MKTCKSHEILHLDGLPEDGDLTGQMVVLHLQSFQVSFHLRNQQSDATFLSLKGKMSDSIFSHLWICLARVGLRLHHFVL